MGLTRAARRWRLVLGALAVLVALAACTPGTGRRPGASLVRRADDGRPNIVFVLADDLAANLVQYMPHVQALMRSGVTFSNYFVVDSLCCPSRSAIFTGQYPHDNGVFTNNRADGGYAAYNHFGDPPKSFAVAVHRAGYRTAMIGKYLNGYEPSAPPARGWDEWDVAGDAYREYDYDLNENGAVHHFGTDPGDYLTHVLSDRATDFVRSSVSAGRPFALELATFAPHRPAVPAPEDRMTFSELRAPRGPAYDKQPSDPPPWLTRFPPLTSTQQHNIDHAFELRVEAVQSVDRTIGVLERLLARRHELRRTYFVFSSDNGYHMGDYRLLPGKQTAFDTDIHVPLVVAGPGIAAGRTVGATASSIDLAPTFAQMAGTTPSDEPDGVSLLSLMRGAPPPAGWQRAVLIEHHGPPTDTGDPDYQTRFAGDPPSYEAMRTRSSLYVEYATGVREYYDLLHDPYELRNLAASLPPRRLALLHTELQRLAHCVGAAECQRAAALAPSAA